MRGPSIELIRYEPESRPQAPDVLGSYTLVVRASGYNMPSEVFIYHAINEENPYSGDVFEAVATPSQIEELPLNNPSFSAETNEGVPFYRRNQLEIYFRSLDELNDFWVELKRQVNTLVKNYKVMEELVNTSLVTLSGGSRIDTTTIDQPSSLITLYTEPATSVDLDVNKNIKTADAGMFGWLPVSEDQEKPSNAKLFYNLGKHAELSEIWESGLKEPYGVHALIINGYHYSTGEHGIYEINQNGIFWLDFDPDNFSGDRLNLPKPTKNPWPDDYFVGYGSSSPNIIRLLLYV